MMIISFAYTTPAVRAGEKTCTRRDWKDDYAKRFREGQLLQGFNLSPRYGGHRFCFIELTEKPYKERYCQVPDDDWYKEGFDYMEKHGLLVGKFTPAVVWETWRKSQGSCWVVRFKIISIKT